MSSYCSHCPRRTTKQCKVLHWIWAECSTFETIPASQPRNQSEEGKTAFIEESLSLGDGASSARHAACLQELWVAWRLCCGRHPIEWQKALCHPLRQLSERRQPREHQLCLGVVWVLPRNSQTSKRRKKNCPAGRCGRLWSSWIALICTEKEDC